MFSYPLTLSFKIIAIAPQVKVTDATGQTVMYVRQKVLALKEDVRVFADEQQQQQLYRIHADRIIDWSARYDVTRVDGTPLGSVKREGMRSLWNATYQVADANGSPVATIHEENPMVKLVDGLVSQVPIVGDIASYFINPTYLVDAAGAGTKLALKKQPAFFEGRFTLDKRGEVSDDEEQLYVASVLMMLLLERGRG